MFCKQSTILLGNHFSKPYTLPRWAYQHLMPLVKSSKRISLYTGSLYQQSPLVEGPLGQPGHVCVTSLKNRIFTRDLLQVTPRFFQIPGAFEVPAFGDPIFWWGIMSQSHRNCQRQEQQVFPCLGPWLGSDWVLSRWAL